MRKILFIFCWLFTLSVYFGAALSAEQFDGLRKRDEAEVARPFPPRLIPYEIEEIKPIFQPILQPESMRMLENVFALWKQKPELNRYTVTTQIKALHCLFMNVQLDGDDKDAANKQNGSIYQLLAAPALPYKADGQSYTFIELLDLFEPILDENPKIVFAEGMSILLNPKNGTPKHKGSTMVDAVRCLYGKSIYAYTQGESREKFQMGAILKLYAFPVHKRILISKNPLFKIIITESPCEACAARAESSEFPKIPFDFAEEEYKS